MNCVRKNRKLEHCFFIFCCLISITKSANAGLEGESLPAHSISSERYNSTIEGIFNDPLMDSIDHYRLIFTNSNNKEKAVFAHVITSNIRHFIKEELIESSTKKDGIETIDIDLTLENVKPEIIAMIVETFYCTIGNSDKPEIIHAKLQKITTKFDQTVEKPKIFITMALAVDKIAAEGSSAQCIINDLLFSLFSSPETSRATHCCESTKDERNDEEITNEFLFYSSMLDKFKNKQFKDNLRAKIEHKLFQKYVEAKIKDEENQPLAKPFGASKTTKSEQVKIQDENEAEKAANSIRLFKEHYNELLEKHPEIYSGAGILIIVDDAHYDMHGNPITKTMKYLLIFFKLTGLNNIKIHASSKIPMFKYYNLVLFCSDESLRAKKNLFNYYMLANHGIFCKHCTQQCEICNKKYRCNQRPIDKMLLMCLYNEDSPARNNVAPFTNLSHVEKKVLYYPEIERGNMNLFIDKIKKLMEYRYIPCKTKYLTDENVTILESIISEISNNQATDGLSTQGNINE